MNSLIDREKYKFIYNGILLTCFYSPVVFALLLFSYLILFFKIKNKLKIILYIIIKYIIIKKQ